MRIRVVSGYTGKDANTLDSKRAQNGIDTRLLEAKEESNFLSPDQYRQLLNMHDDSDAGLRNKVLLGLLFEYGLRVSEATNLTLESIDIDNGRMAVFRQKTGETTIFDLLVTSDLYRLLKKHLDRCAKFNQVYVLMPSTKDGNLTEHNNAQPLGRIPVYRLLQRMGKAIGIDNFSPHDARHTALQLLLEKGISTSVIMDFFGWKTRTMIDQYRQRPAIANRGVSVY